MKDRLVALETTRLEEAREERALKNQRLELDQLRYYAEQKEREQEKEQARERRAKEQADWEQELVGLKGSLAEAWDAIRRQQKVIEQLQAQAADHKAQEKQHEEALRQQAFVQDKEIAMLRVEIERERGERAIAFRSMMETIQHALAAEDGET